MDSFFNNIILIAIIMKFILELIVLMLQDISNKLLNRKGLYISSAIQRKNIFLIFIGLQNSEKPKLMQNHGKYGRAVEYQ